MADIRELSNEELLKIADEPVGDDLETKSEEELRAIVGEPETTEPKRPTLTDIGPFPPGTPPPVGTIAEALERGIAGRATPLKRGDIPEFARTDINPFEGALKKLSARGRASFGNDKGTVAMLKRENKKFEKVVVNKDGGISIKKDGEWIFFDPSGIPGADGWSITELFSDALDLGEIIPTTIGSILGGTVGAIAGLAGGPTAPATVTAGVIAGSTAGALFGEYINQSLGRAFGTYDATPAEMVADYTFEGVFNILGFTFKPIIKSVAPGVRKGIQKVTDELFDNTFTRPTVEALQKGLAKGTKKLVEPFKRRGKKVLRPSGRILADGLMTGTGVDKDVAENVLMNPIGALQPLKKVLNDERLFGKPNSEILAEFPRMSVNVVKKRLLRVKKDISDAFEAAKEVLFKSEDMAKFEVDVSTPAFKFMEGLEELGLGKIKVATGLVDQAGVPISRKITFEELSEDQLVKLLQTTNVSELITRNTAKKIGTLIREVNDIAKLGKLKGKAGAKKAIELRQKIDEILFESRVANPAALGKETKITEARLLLSSSFAKSSPDLGAKYNSMNAIWRDSREHAETIGRVLKQGTRGVANFTRRLLKTRPSPKVGEKAIPDPGFDTKETWRYINNFGGDAGRKADQALLDIKTSAQMYDKFPHVRAPVSEKLPTAFGTTQAAAEVGRFVPGLVGITSPRIRARFVSAASQGVRLGTEAVAQGAGIGSLVAGAIEGVGPPDPFTESIPFIKNLRDVIAFMPKSQKKLLLENPDILSKMFDSVIRAPEESSAIEGDLLNEANQQLIQQQQQQLFKSRQ